MRVCCWCAEDATHELVDECDGVVWTVDPACADHAAEWCDTVTTVRRLADGHVLTAGERSWIPVPLPDVPVHAPCPMAARGFGFYYVDRVDAERAYGWVIRDGERQAVQRAREHVALVTDSGPVLVGRSRMSGWETYALADLAENPAAAHDPAWHPVALVIRED